MYKAIRSGSHNHVRFNAGDKVPGNKGEYDSCKSLVWIKEAEFEDLTGKPVEGTVKEIKAWLDDNDVEYPALARKDKLIEILENA